MADENLLAEFEEFLTAKREAEKNEQSAEDFEVEIWDEKGRGVRTKRSHAKPFLQSLGLDADPEPDKDSGDTDKSSGTPDKSKSRQTRNTPTGSNSTVRKYFTKAAAK